MTITQLLPFSAERQLLGANPLMLCCCHRVFVQENGLKLIFCSASRQMSLLRCCSASVFFLLPCWTGSPLSCSEHCRNSHSWCPSNYNVYFLSFSLSPPVTVSTAAAVSSCLFPHLSNVFLLIFFDTFVKSPLTFVNFSALPLEMFGLLLIFWLQSITPSSSSQQYSLWFLSRSLFLGKQWFWESK